MKILFELDVKLPKIKKVFFCIPLRLGLLFWGYIQLICAFIYFLYVVVAINGPQYHPRDEDLGTSSGGYWSGPSFATRDVYDSLPVRNEFSVFLWVLNCIFFLIIWTPLEVLASFFLVIGGHKRNGTYLELSYYYFKLKVFVYGALLVICSLLALFGNFYTNDGWPRFMSFFYPDIGALIWLLQLYLFLLINTMLLQLKHKTDFATLCRRLKESWKGIEPSSERENIIEEIKNEEEGEKKRIDEMVTVDLTTVNSADV